MSFIFCLDVISGIILFNHESPRRGETFVTRKITRAAVWANFVWGVGLTVANIFGKFIASPINCGAIAMVGGLIIVPLISLITPKLEKSKVDEMFACYDEKVEVAKKMVLKEE